MHTGHGCHSASFQLKEVPMLTAVILLGIAFFLVVILWAISREQ
jgi:hypothetical protein